MHIHFDLIFDLSDPLGIFSQPKLIETSRFGHQFRPKNAQKRPSHSGQNELDGPVAQ